MAEAYYKSGRAEEAKKALFFVAQRDEDVKAKGSISAEGDDLFKLIEMERVKELVAEGFNFYDMRRWGSKIEKGKQGVFDLGNFALPIPADEINSGFGVVQNPKNLWSPIE